MHTYLKEKIGNPELFTGRKKELTWYLNWIDRIKQELSMSQAILSRRKTGKTAFLQRLYNLTFEKNDGIIPFYYEIGEGKKWAVPFCQDFFLTFICQYIAFHTRKAKYVRFSEEKGKVFSTTIEIAEQEGLDYLVETIKEIEYLVQTQNRDLLWQAVRDMPRNLAAGRDEFIVQIIDEFQFLNSEIYWDEEKTNQANDFAAGYMKTAEYKNAPLLVSGSWVGWLFNELIMMLPGRFQMDFLEPLPEDEAVEMVFKYAHIEQIPVTDETAYLIAELTEGSPFYISALFRSRFPHKDLTTQAGLLNTLEFETLDARGIIKGTWMEYIASALPRINERHAKKIVLYLCKHKDRQISRRELKRELKLKMSDQELAEKMNGLLRADIINRGRSSFRYQAVQDNIFDKVFRGEFGEDIEEFEASEDFEEFDEGRIIEEYEALLKELQKQYH